MSRLIRAVRRAITGDTSAPPDLEATLANVRAKLPSPVFWMLGKTQTGKSSLVRFLTGADEAAIGNGFRPCTKTSRVYHFPTNDAPLLTFLDTRGLDEPGYDATEDIAAFNEQAHVVIVTAKLTDFAQGNVRHALERVRHAEPARPVVLVLTCLHEAIPRQPHPAPYPFAAPAHAVAAAIPQAITDCIAKHQEAFAGLVDVCVPVDLTKPEDGFADPHYGGEHLKQTLLKLLPGAHRQTLLQLKEATTALKSAHERHAEPVILGYASLAATAGALPMPFLDLLLLPGIHTRMAHHLGQLYGQPLTAERFRELAAAIGVGMVSRQLLRQAAKMIPVVGSAVGAAVAFASTYALGRALCYYFAAVCEGHVPTPDHLRKYFQEEYKSAENHWKTTRKADNNTTTAP
jgi:uncharacterized protein (DUF697 family)